MSYTDLQDLKNRLFGPDGRVVRTNKFSVDFNLKSPISGSWISAAGEAAVAVSASSLSLRTQEWEFQNMPIEVPIKRMRNNKLLITFYGTRNMSAFTTLLSLIKQYGGHPLSQTSASNNAPTAYRWSQLYNIAIAENWGRVNILNDGQTPFGASSVVNSITYTHLYPVEMFPVDFDSTSPSMPLTYTCLFNYKTAWAQNEATPAG
jgi:hypothetical protein